MNSGPIRLANFGSKCYLNSGIQALSSCRHFVEEIEKLRSKKGDLKKLKLFVDLMSLMNGSGRQQDISSNRIFQEWNKPGQQDSFELLAHVINQVYDEIRLFKENNNKIEEGNTLEWIKTKLPMRICMEYEITCECSKKESSPLQSEIALHLSFLPLDASQPCDIDMMLKKHFDEDVIEDYSCYSPSCVRKRASRRLWLHQSLPNTICIHLQRLRWDGRQMKKIDDKVLFCNRITIKKEYLWRSGSEDTLRDRHYYLRSVIVHHGGESFGHYQCYKRHNNEWYCTDDSSVNRVTVKRVFSCNPYILFYERDEDEPVSMTVVKYDPMLNVFVHALSSCQDFVKWLNDVAAVNQSALLTELVYFVDLANGNRARNERRERRVSSCFKHGKDAYEMMMSILEHIKKDLNTRNQVQTPQTPDDTGFSTQQLPLSLTMVRVKSCGCSIDRSVKMSLHLSFKDKVNLQRLLDEYFLNQFNARVCDRVGCRDKGRKGDRGTDQFGILLPAILCIVIDKKDTYLKGTTRQDWRCVLDDKIIIRRRLVCIGRNGDQDGNSDTEYYLKAVFSKDKCLRNIDEYWYMIGPNYITNDVSKTFEGNNRCVLFYDRIPRTHRKDVSQAVSSVSHSVVESHASTDLEMIPTKDHRIFVPQIISKGKQVNCFIHALSSCTNFVTILKSLSDNSMSSLTFLLRLSDLSNGIVTNNSSTNENELNEWCKCKDVPTLMIKVLNDIFVDIKHPAVGILKDDISGLVVRRFSCDCGYNTSTTNVNWFIDVSGGENSPILQNLVDRFFAKKTIDGKVCENKDCHEKNGCTFNKLFMPLWKTVFVQIESRNRVRFSAEIIISTTSYVNSSGPNTNETYLLQAIITDNPLICYRRINSKWYEVTERKVSEVSENNVLQSQPSLLFYECEESKTTDNNLRWVHQLLSSCSLFVDWLKAGLTTKTIKYLSAQTNHPLKPMKVFEAGVSRWNDDNYCDIYGLLKALFTEMNNHQPTLMNSLAMHYQSKSVNKCNCESTKYEYGKSDFLFQIGLPRPDPQSTKLFTIQELLDQYIASEISHSSITNCSCREGLLVEHLPKLLCIKLSRMSHNDTFDKCNSNVTLTKVISIGPQDTNIEPMRYHLKSVIQHSGSTYTCYRRFGNTLICADDHRNDTLDDEVMEYIILYETDHSSSTTPELAVFNCLQSLSFCSAFLRNVESVNERSEYLPILKELAKINDDSETLLSMVTSCSRSDVDGSLITPFISILPELDRNSHSIVIFNVGMSDSNLLSSSWIINVQIPSHSSSSSRTLQQVLDLYFEFYSNQSSLKKSLLLKNNKDSYKQLIKGIMPETIGFYFPQNSSSDCAVVCDPVADIIIKNQLCRTTESGPGARECCSHYGNCCMKYRVKSLIDQRSQCYHLCDYRWYKVNQTSPSTVMESQLDTAVPQIIFYEPYNTERITYV